MRFLRVPAFFFGPISGVTRVVLAGTTGALALMAFVIAAGMFWRDPDAEQGERGERREYIEDEERTSISLGWLVHGLLSLKARLRLLFAERSAPSSARTAVARARLEPRLSIPMRSKRNSTKSGRRGEEEAGRAPPQARHAPVRQRAGAPAAMRFLRSIC